jgi:hypothetical protein
MQRQIIEDLILGKALWGFLKFKNNETSESLPGTIKLDSTGQITVEVVVQEDSPVLLNPQHPTVVNPQAHVNIPNYCEFHSVGGYLVLFQTGSPNWYSYSSGHPVELSFKPIFVIADRLAGFSWQIPNSVRAEIGGLSNWMHASRITRPLEINTQDNDKRGNALVTLETRDFPQYSFQLTDVRFNRRIVIRPSQEPFRSQGADEIGIRFRVLLESTDDSATTWREKLRVLHHFQDLVILLSWTPYGPGNLTATFPRGSQNSLSSQEGDTAHPPTTSSHFRVFNKRFPAKLGASTSTTSPDFILPFTDLDAEVITKWYELRESKAHPLELFLQVIKAPQMEPTVKALQFGAGIESLGFKLYEAESSKNKANQINTIKLFEKVAESTLRLFPREFENWAKEANCVYQAMKHLKRQLPSLGKIAAINDRTSLVLQIWLATYLGASDESIMNYVIPQRRLTSEYERVPDLSSLKVDKAL